MKATVSEIKYVKSIIDLLNEYYPPVIYENTEANINIVLQHNFTSYLEENSWKICCSNYWIFTDPDFQNIKENMLLIASEEDIDIQFIMKHNITQLLKKNQNVKKIDIFLGRADIKVLS